MSSDSWLTKMAYAACRRSDTDRLILNYFIVMGFKEAAEEFSKEAGLEMPPNFLAMEERLQIRKSITNGDIDSAIQKLMAIDSQLPDRDVNIYFTLLKQKFIDLVRSDQSSEALLFAQTELAPRVLGSPELMKELENLVSLLVFPDIKSSRELLTDTQRQKTANQVNIALLRAVGADSVEPKLCMLLKFIQYTQDTFSRQVGLPAMINFEKGLIVGADGVPLEVSPNFLNIHWAKNALMGGTGDKVI